MLYPVPSQWLFLATACDIAKADECGVANASAMPKCHKIPHSKSLACRISIDHDSNLEFLRCLVLHIITPHCIFITRPIKPTICSHALFALIAWLVSIRSKMLIFYLLNGPTGQWTDRPVDQWTNGPADQWTDIPAYQWTYVPAYQWNDGVMDGLTL